MIQPTKYTNSNTTLGYSSTDLGNLLARREFFTTGVLWSWGTNTDFGVGDGTTVTRSSPVTIAVGPGNWEWISARARTGAAIRSDGTLWTWGRGTYGVLGNATATSRSSPGTTSVGGTTWDEVSTSTAHMLAVKNDGTLWTWGRNTSGQLGTASTVSRSSPGTTAGGSSISDNWKNVAAGGDTSAGIKTDGSLWTWGLNNNGQLGDGTTTNRSSPGTTSGAGTTWDKVSISNTAAAGSVFMAAVKTDGTLWTWGGNIRGQLGDGTTASRSSPGTTIAGGTNWRDVATGDDHVVATKTDGTLWTWGSNSSGELGAGSASSRSSPGTTNATGTTWKTVSAATGVSSGIKTDGTLWTWGANGSGQLGNGTTTNRSSPGTAFGWLNAGWKYVAVGGASTGGSCAGIIENETFFPTINAYKAPGGPFTETIPEGHHSVIIEVWGGGGGGGDGYQDIGGTPFNGGNGGRGGYVRSVYDVRYQVGKTMTVYIGNGGIGSSAFGGPGGDGESSNVASGTFAVTLMTGNFGTGGDSAPPAGSGSVGTNGTGTGGTDYNSTSVSADVWRGQPYFGINFPTGGGAFGGDGASSSPGLYIAGQSGQGGLVTFTYL